MPATYRWQGRRAPAIVSLPSQAPLRTEDSSLAVDPDERIVIAATRSDDEAAVRRVAWAIVAATSATTAAERLEAIISFVQSFPYEHVENEPYSPLATLARRRASCAPRSILLASLLRPLGHPSRFVLFAGRHGEPGHCALEVVDPTYLGAASPRWCFVESTAPTPLGDGWPRAPDERLPVEPIASLRLEYQATLRATGAGRGVLSVRALVKNVGTTSARGVVVALASPDHDEPVRSPARSIPHGTSTEATLDLPCFAPDEPFTVRVDAANARFRRLAGGRGNWE